MKKILIIQTASIGDVILATPIIEKLYLFYPAAEIDFLLKKGTSSLFSGHPFLHEILVWDKSNGKYKNFLTLLQRILLTKYDLVINLQRFFMTGLLTVFSGAVITIGFDKNPFSFFFTRRIKHQIGNGLHEAERNLAMISSITDESFLPPRLYPTAENEKSVQRWKKGRYYTLSPASLWFTKQYPEIKWTELLDRIPSDAPVYLLGSAADTPLCYSILKRSTHQNTIDLSGKLTFLESAALMKGARMNFTNDSAPMHLASAVNAPVTAIFCSTTPDFGFGPISDDSSIVETQEKLTCRPCGLHGYRKCPESHFRCALSLPVSLLQQRL